MRKKKLEWYAMIVDFNTKKIELINILNERIVDSVRKKLRKIKEPITFDIVKLELSITLKYHYWSKCEYEILVSDLYADNITKIDVWYQLEPNIDRIVEYFIKNLKIEVK